MEYIEFCSESGTPDLKAVLLPYVFDSVFGKRVLMYWENKGTPYHSQMNGF